MIFLSKQLTITYRGLLRVVEQNKKRKEYFSSEKILEYILKSFQCSMFQNICETQQIFFFKKSINLTKILNELRKKCFVSNDKISQQLIKTVGLKT